jgi:hypothetical protein
MMKSASHGALRLKARLVQTTGHEKWRKSGKKGKILLFPSPPVLSGHKIGGAFSKNR